MRLTKHHGLGNDFLVLLDPEATHPLDAEIARQLCDRHTGVGADGVMRAVPAAPGEAAVARMELRNADGSRAEMSGNGIRCFAQALRLGGWPGADGDEIAVATDAGLRTVAVHGRLDEVTLDLSVDMGTARITGEAPEWTGGAIGRALLVDVGNPHLVLDLSAAPAEAAAEVDLVAVGESVNAKISGGANVHLLTTEGDTVVIRPYERGVGPTRACGTGACASAAAARRWGLAGDRVPVAMPGGRVEVALGPGEDDPVRLRGPATYVAEVVLGVSPWR